MIGVEPKVITEGLLIAHGFTRASELSTRLLQCLEKLQVQYIQCKRHVFYVELKRKVFFTIRIIGMLNEQIFEQLTSQ